MRNQVKNAIILMPVVAGVAYAGYLLYKDQSLTPTSAQNTVNREPIGEVISSENNVKREFGDDVLWNNIQKSEAVYNRDSVRTGKDSTAVIKLKDGSVLEMAENSLIVLDKSNENLDIKFKAGDLLAKNSGKNLQIAVKDSIIKGENADLKIKTGPNDKTQVTVAKGKASVIDKNKKKTDIGEAEAAEMGDSGIQAVNRVAVVLKTPKDRTQRQSNGAVNQLFTWDVLDPKLQNEQLELSSNEKFSTGTTRVLKAHQAVNAPVAKGTTFWRVGWQVGPKVYYTEARQFSVSADNRLELVYPENQTTFNFDPDENAIDMSWNSRIEPKAYAIEVATSPDFKILKVAETLDAAAGTKHTLKNLDPGTYYWRVRAFGDKRDEIAASPVFSFTLKVKLARLPELLKPDPDATLGLDDPAEFSWKKLDKSTEYRVVISSDAEQKEIIRSKTSAAANFAWKSFRPGIYYWSVKALNAKSVTVGQSDTRKFTVALKDRTPTFEMLSPKDQTEVIRELNATPEPVTFQWKVLRKLPGPVSISISRDAEFKDSVKQDNLAKTMIAVRLHKPGVYYWKLASRSIDGKTEETSTVASFALKALNTLLPPQIIQPANADKIEINEPFPVEFSWKPVIGAVQYHIVVQRFDPRTHQPVAIMDRMLKEASVTSSALPEGDYIWTLTATDAGGQEGLAEKPYEFHLVPHEEMEAPKVNAPVVK